MQITLKNLHQATPQQVFEQVANHLLTQGRKSIVGGACQYRGGDNTMCAAGCLIGDDEYNASMMEGSSWRSLEIGKVVPFAHSKLIHALQRIHDGFPTDRWLELLTEEAKYRGLDASFLRKYVDQEL